MSAACTPTYVEVPTLVPIDPELRKPCIVDPPKNRTQREVLGHYVRTVEGLDCANGRITAIDATLTAAEKEFEKE